MRSKRKALSVEIACPFCPEDAGVTMIGEVQRRPPSQFGTQALIFGRLRSAGWTNDEKDLKCIACGGRMAVDVYAAPKPKGRKK